MTKEQGDLLLSGLKKIANRMDELKAIGIEFKDMGNYEVALTLAESAVLSQFAGLGLDVYKEMAPIIQLEELMKSSFGISLLN